MTGIERFRLDGKVVVVTGAAGGIGAATAALLRDAGATVVGADVQPAPDIVATDVSRKADVDELVDRTVTAHGTIDGFVNVAGIVHSSLVVDTEEADLDRVLAVNLKGVFFGCQAAARTMIASGTKGSIVNISSGAAYVPAPQRGAYAMAKAGVVALTRTLAAEVGRHGIRVNGVAPGFVVSPMTLRHVADGDDAAREQLIEGSRRFSPMRMVGEPDDIAPAVLYLLSDAARYVTGQMLHPNGGSVMTS